MGLSWSYDPGHVLWLILVAFFFNFMLQNLFDWELDFIIYFDLFSIELS